MSPTQHTRRARALRRLAAATIAAAALPASAAVMNAWQLNVYRDGSSADWLLGNQRLLGDGFDNGNPLLGPAFSSTGQAATYALYGLADPAQAALAAYESGSALRLNPHYGTASPNAAGQAGRSLRLQLLTNITDPAAGLSQSRSFSASLRLALSDLPGVGQSFGLRLTDGFSDASDVIDLYVSGGAAGPVLTFRKQDFLHGSITPLGSALLSAPAGAGALVLSLTHGTAGTNTISGSYAYADGSGALITGFTGFGNVATAFNGEAHTRIELRAAELTSVVPEPGRWALFAAGLAGLGWRARRRG